MELKTLETVKDGIKNLEVENTKARETIRKKAMQVQKNQKFIDALKEMAGIDDADFDEPPHDANSLFARATTTVHTTTTPRKKDA